eukprot:scaffold172025_cov41-Tisochrysis_lutea.AAC.3
MRFLLRLLRPDTPMHVAHLLGPAAGSINAHRYRASVCAWRPLPPLKESYRHEHQPAPARTDRAQRSPIPSHLCDAIRCSVLQRTGPMTLRQRATACLSARRMMRCAAFRRFLTWALPSPVWPAAWPAAV